MQALAISFELTVISNIIRSNPNGIWMKRYRTMLILHLLFKLIKCSAIKAWIKMLAEVVQKAYVSTAQNCTKV